MLGVSTDPLPVQAKFAESLKLPFPLLSDEHSEAARAYGVAADGVARRVTFVIGADRRVLRVLQGAEALDPAVALSACRKP